jgi:hypothetical protein
MLMSPFQPEHVENGGLDAVSSQALFYVCVSLNPYVLE